MRFRYAIKLLDKSTYIDIYIRVCTYIDKLMHMYLVQLENTYKKPSSSEYQQNLKNALN